MSSALLVIDMQKDLCNDVKRIDKVRAMLPHLLEAIDRFVEADIPIFYIRFSLPPDDDQFRRFGDRYCVAGTSGADIIDELYPLKGRVVEKTKHSAFFETGLGEMLQNIGVKDVYLTGMQTQICILTTAADASFRGFNPIAIRDCVLSTRDDKKEQSLDWIAKYVGEVISLQQALE